MKIEIENYKGNTIYYDDDKDKFLCDIEMDGNVKSSKRGSLNDLRREIDFFIKENMNFKPFKAIKEDYDGFRVVDVNALRTDGKLIVDSGYSASYYSKKDSEKLRNYDEEIIKEQEAAKKKLEEARELYKATINGLYKRLVPMDLSKYDLK